MLFQWKIELAYSKTWLSIPIIIMLQGYLYRTSVPVLGSQERTWYLVAENLVPGQLYLVNGQNSKSSRFFHFLSVFSSFTGSGFPAPPRYRTVDQITSSFRKERKKTFKQTPIPPAAPTKLLFVQSIVETRFIVASFFNDRTIPGIENLFFRITISKKKTA